MVFVLLAKLIFFSSVGLLVYVYVGYPLLVWSVSRLAPRNVLRSAYEPTVTIVIAAYNEARDIRSKLENTLTIDYPPDKLEIIVASDSSTDRTDDIVREFAGKGVKLFRQDERKGKTSAQNLAVEKATGEIILFSDATTLYEPGVLRAMLPNFADASVGCVAGKLVYVDDSGSRIGRGAKSYWSYETLLKQSESTACSLVGTSGCLYAVRRSAYIPMYPEACSDFLISTLVYKQGLRTVFEPAAVCTEETNREFRKEFQMRVRVTVRTLTDLWRNAEMLNPVKTGFFAVQLVSHKILRYAVPFMLIGMWLSSGFLAMYSQVFLAIFSVQTLFYAFALAGMALETFGTSSRIFAVPLYFALVNTASFIAFYKVLRGEKIVSWETVRTKTSTLRP